MGTQQPPSLVNVHDAKTHFSRLLERAHAGEEIILAKAGKPYAKLVPYHPAVGVRRPGGLTLTAPADDSVWFDPLSEEDLAAWEGAGRLPD